MAAPLYATDLQTITDADSITGWVVYGGGAAGISTGPDLAMQSTVCVDKVISASEKGQMFVAASTITPGASEHFFTWLFMATPGQANSLSSRGLAAVIGDSTAAFIQFHVEGTDTYGAAGRVGKCYPIRYTTVASAVPPYRTAVGTPTGGPKMFGATANITGTVKGVNLGADAVRRGTGAYITAGDSITPATFDGFSSQNDLIANRWGILTALGGSYELQGRFVVGQTSAYAVTQAYFSDSNRVISLVNTVHSQTDFTQIVVDNSSTIFNLTNITFLALGTNNPGQLTFNSSLTISTIVGCVFNNFGATNLQLGVTARENTWRSAGLVTQNKATIQNCVFSNSVSSASLKVDNPAVVSSCSFVSDGSNHAVEIISTGTYAFANNAFSGYSTVDGSGGNEVIYNNSGGLVTLQVSGTTAIVSVRNSVGSTTSVETAATVTFQIVDSNGSSITDTCELTVTRASDDVQLFNDGSIVTGQTQYTYTAGAGTATYIVVLNTANYQNKVINGFTLPAASQTVTIQLDDERYYSNP